MAQGINPEVGYEFDAFRLNGGLDLTSPKIDAPKGTLLDVLNRDTIDRIGYRRINGFEPYDGRTSPAQIEYYTLTDTGYAGPANMDGTLTGFEAGTVLIVEDDTDQIFGVVVTSSFLSAGVGQIVYARVNEDAEPAVGQVVNGYGTTTPDFTVTSKAVYAGTDAADTVSDMNGFNTALRSRITSLRDTPIGLHWYRDQLYAVVDEAVVYFTQASGTTEIVPNSLLSKDAGASTARVLSVVLTSGTWAGGDASGMMTIEVLTGTWATSGTVSVTAPTNTTTVTLRAATASDSQPLYASLYRSRSEQQAVDDGDTPSDAGWSRIDHGWEADFNNGNSTSGGLTVVSRGDSTNFTYDEGSTTPATTFIDNGFVISGIPTAPRASAQYTDFAPDPGWKTNVSAPDYATSSELITALASDDSAYAYGNLYFYASPPGGFANFSNGYLAQGGNFILGTNNTTNATYPVPSTVGTETFDTDFNTTNLIVPIILRDFTTAITAIPDGSVVTGMTVTVKYDSQIYVVSQMSSPARSVDVEDTIEAMLTNTFSWGSCFIESDTATTASTIGSVRSAAIAIDDADNWEEDNSGEASTPSIIRFAQTLANQTATIGGSTDDFDTGGLSKTRFSDPNFGVALFGYIAASNPFGTIGDSSALQSGELQQGIVRVKVDQVQVTFHFTTPSARYFVGDGAGNICSVDVTFFVTEDGSFRAGNASGSVQFTNLIPNVSGVPYTGGGTKRTVESGDEFFVSEADAIAGTSPVLALTSNAEYNGLPARNRLITNASRYQFITANFFGRDEWDGFYGVSGAGRAFSFATYDADGSAGNEDYIIKITTNTLDSAGDTPRHIAFHHYALALGFRSGIVRFSVPGEPENFDGVQGAAEVGVGDKVTGLLSMRGTVLGVFCENSIWGIAGTDADNYQTQVLAPYTGAIEYSVVDMGIPVYCDNRGISTLEQSEKYGNFLGRRLSYNVTPFILPRMIRNNAQFSGKGIVCAVPFRADNQYLVFFKDGKVLVMTMNPDGQPSFTYSTYYIGSGTSGNFLVPFAWSAQVDDKGIDRVHVSHFSPLSTVSDANGLKVYEINRGWGFAGEPIPNYYTVNWYYKDPFTVTTLKKIRLDGLTQGVSSCKVSLAKEYDTTFSTSSADINLRVGQIGGTEVYTTDLVPASVMANVAERGRSITFKVEGTNAAPIPPDIHQIILPHFDAGGKIDS